MLYSPVKSDSYFFCKGLALQDYNNKAPDDELPTVPCLDKEALWLILLYLIAHKLVW